MKNLVTYPKVTWNRLSPSTRRALTNWSCVAGVIYFSISIVGLFNIRWAIGLAWSFPHGETAMGYWMTKIGLSLLVAAIISTLCCAVASYGWYYLIYNTEELCKLLNNNGNEGSEHDFYYRLAKKVPYVAIPLCSFGPDGGIFVSGLLSKTLGLNIYSALALATIGSAIKNVTWGLGFNSPRTRYITWGFAVAFIVIAAAKILRRYLRRKREIEGLKSLLAK